jgi:hypothetical protein
VVDELVKAADDRMEGKAAMQRTSKDGYRQCEGPEGRRSLNVKA